MEKKTTCYIDLVPAGKGKRRLVFLADFFICFILSLSLFSLAAYPIAKQVPSVKEAAKTEEEGQKEKRNLLVGNHLLSRTDDRDRNDTSSIREYSSLLFLKGKLDSSEDNDYFAAYYLEIKRRTFDELSDVYRHTSTNLFFEPVDGKRKRKEKYAVEFSPLLDEKDDRTDQGKTDLSYFKNSFFSLRYGNRLKDRGDKSNEGAYFSSFRAADDKRRQGRSAYKESIVLSTFISYFVSAIILFLAVPLIHKRGKTLGRRAMKRERISRNGFRPLSKLKRCYIFFLQSLFSLASILFVPCFYVPFTQVFSFYQLLSVSLCAIGLDVISLVFLVFNGYNRSFMDWLSSSVRILSLDYESLPRSKQ